MMPSSVRFMVGTIPFVMSGMGLYYIIQSTKDEKNKSGNLAIGIPLFIIGMLWIFGLFNTR
jgi:hypothetical protein